MNSERVLYCVTLRPPPVTNSSFRVWGAAATGEVHPVYIHHIHIIYPLVHEVVPLKLHFELEVLDFYFHRKFFFSSFLSFLFFSFLISLL